MNKFLQIICFGLILFSSCTTLRLTKDNQYIYLQKEGRENKKWKLVWEDDFNGAAIDSSKWSKIPSGGSDWNKIIIMDVETKKILDLPITPIIRDWLNQTTSKPPIPLGLAVLLVLPITGR